MMITATKEMWCLSTERPASHTFRASFSRRLTSSNVSRLH